MCIYINGCHVYIYIHFDKSFLYKYCLLLLIGKQQYFTKDKTDIEEESMTHIDWLFSIVLRNWDMVLHGLRQ